MCRVCETRHKHAALVSILLTLERKMAESVKITHNGVAIMYQEAENAWKFELRGCERSASSLTKAREAIDAPPPKDKKAFKRQKAFYCSYGSGPLLVVVTSLAETSYRSQQVWLVKGGRRSRESLDSLRAFTPESERIVAEYHSRATEIEKLRETNQKLLAGMQKLDLTGVE